MATKLGDLTVGADGSWSSGPHAMTAGAKTVTLRRKSDGAVLVTRNFTVTASALAASDDFNRASLNSPTAQWTAITGMTLPTLTSNVITPNLTTRGMRWSKAGDSFAANQYAETYPSGGSTPGYNSAAVTADVMEGPAARIQAGSKTFYFAGVGTWDDGQGTVGTCLKLWKCVAGTYTQLGSTYDIPGAYPFVKLEVSGNALTVKTADTHGGTYTTRITASNASQTADGLDSGSAGYVGEYTGSSTSDWWGGDL